MRPLNCLRTIVVLVVAMPALAPAQDLGSILSGVVGRTFGDAASKALRSITTVSIGRILDGTLRPADTEGKVILYRNATCGYCKQAAAYMRTRNIPFVERDINRDKAYYEEYRAYGGNGGVPLIVFGTETMSGFSPAAFDRHYAAMPSRAAPATGPAGLQAGDLLRAKLKTIAVRVAPDRSARELGALERSDNAVYMGEERNGFYRVTTAEGEGWIDKLLVGSPGT